MNDYKRFIETKHKLPETFGFDVSESHFPASYFKPFQAASCRFAVRRGRAALFAGTGLGKTRMQLGIGQAWLDLGGASSVLLLAPLGVTRQTVNEGKKIGIDVTPCRSQEDARNGLNITNYEMLHAFDASQFDGVILDECFPAGTLVDTPSGQCRIDSLRKGDKIVNCSGIDEVLSVKRKRVEYAVRINAGSEITSSPNHPYFTQRGWRCAQDLEPGDCILQTAEAVRVLRGEFSSAAVLGKWDDEVLREVLLSEMEDAATATHCEGSQSDCCEETRGSEVAMVSFGKYGCESRIETNSVAEPDGEPCHAGQSKSNSESDETCTFRAWRKRTRNDRAAASDSEIVGRWMGSRIEHIVGYQKGRISDELQSRLSEQRKESRYRSGWTLPPCDAKEVAGCEERCDARFVRVESLEVLELGHTDLDRLGDAEGQLYFYDLEVARHPSFSVEGLVVHNSSILKSFMGATKRKLCEAFSHTRYRLVCTATPSPNDHLELGNQAEFLGIMPANEMICRWFINNTMEAGDYRLKGHAAADFWRWMASWALCIGKPSDIGFDDEGYILPPLTITTHVVDDCELPPAEGMLFHMPELSATNIHKELKATKEARASNVAERVNSHKEPHLVWCYTDYDADELTARIPDAVEIRGSMPVKLKEDRLAAFTDGTIRTLVTKPTVAGFGLNWQHCNVADFAGLTYSMESFYQAMRRIYRFGQSRPVTGNVVCSQTELALLETIKHKESLHNEMFREMASAMKGSMLENLGQRKLMEYKPTKPIELPAWVKSKSEVLA